MTIKRSKIRLGLLGASGKMGHALLRLLENEPAYMKKFSLVFQASRPEDAHFQDVLRLKPDVVVDFSRPEGTLAMAKLCAQVRVPLLVCTTGFTPAQKAALGRIKGGLIHHVPNTSLGVMAMKAMIEAALPLLPPDFHVSMSEVHHVHKKDTPSGTALDLQKTALKADPKRKISITSLRAGEVVGTHTLVIEGPAERLELKHEALDRSLFAHGALRLAEELALKKKPARRKSK